MAKVVAFYGFKGGSGRSMLLANFAAAAAALGKQILVIDCDLEAPGLGDFFDLPSRPTYLEWRKNRGILDLLHDREKVFSLPHVEESLPSQWVDSIREKLFGNNGLLVRTEPHQAEHHYFYRVGPEDPPGAEKVQSSSAAETGRIAIMGPGRHTGYDIPSPQKYLERVVGFDWSQFLRADGNAFLAALGEALRSQLAYDLVLLDARTGYNLASISMIQAFATDVVVVGTAAMQSIDGVARMVPLISNGVDIVPHLVLSKELLADRGDSSISFENEQRFKAALISGYHESLSNVASTHSQFGRADREEMPRDTAAKKPTLPTKFYRLPFVKELQRGDSVLWARFSGKDLKQILRRTPEQSRSSDGFLHREALQIYCDEFAAIFSEVLGETFDRTKEEKAFRFWRRPSESRKAFGDASSAKTFEEVRKEVERIVGRVSEYCGGSASEKALSSQSILEEGQEAQGPEGWTGRISPLSTSSLELIRAELNQLEVEQRAYCRLEILKELECIALESNTASSSSDQGTDRGTQSGTSTAKRIRKVFKELDLWSVPTAISDDLKSLLVEGSYDSQVTVLDVFISAALEREITAKYLDQFEGKTLSAEEEQTLELARFIWKANTGKTLNERFKATQDLSLGLKDALENPRTYPFRVPENAKQLSTWHPLDGLRYLRESLIRIMASESSSLETVFENLNIIQDLWTERLLSMTGPDLARPSVCMKWLGTLRESLMTRRLVFGHQLQSSSWSSITALPPILTENEFDRLLNWAGRPVAEPRRDGQKAQDWPAHEDMVFDFLFDTILRFGWRHLRTREENVTAEEAPVILEYDRRDSILREVTSVVDLASNPNAMEWSNAFYALALAASGMARSDSALYWVRRALQALRPSTVQESRVHVRNLSGLFLVRQNAVGLPISLDAASAFSRQIEASKPSQDSEPSQDSDRLVAPYAWWPASDLFVRGAYHEAWQLLDDYEKQLNKEHSQEFGSFGLWAYKLAVGSCLKREDMDEVRQRLYREARFNLNIQDESFSGLFNVELSALTALLADLEYGSKLRGTEQMSTHARIESQLQRLCAIEKQLAIKPWRARSARAWRKLMTEFWRVLKSSEWIVEDDTVERAAEYIKRLGKWFRDHPLVSCDRRFAESLSIEWQPAQHSLGIFNGEEFPSPHRNEYAEALAVYLEILMYANDAERARQITELIEHGVLSGYDISRADPLLSKVGLKFCHPIAVACAVRVKFGWEVASSSLRALRHCRADLEANGGGRWPFYRRVFEYVGLSRPEITEITQSPSH